MVVTVVQDGSKRKRWGIFQVVQSIVLMVKM